MVRAFRLPVAMTDSLESADLMVTTKTHFKRNPKLLRSAEEREVPVHVLRKNSKVQVEQFLKRLGKSNGRGSYQLPTGRWRRLCRRRRMRWRKSGAACPT